MEMNLGNLSVIVFGILMAIYFFGRWWNKRLGLDPHTGKALTSKKRSDD